MEIKFNFEKSQFGFIVKIKTSEFDESFPIFNPDDIVKCTNHFFGEGSYLPRNNDGTILDYKIINSINWVPKISIFIQKIKFEFFNLLYDEIKEYFKYSDVKPKLEYYKKIITIIDNDTIRKIN